MDAPNLDELVVDMSQLTIDLDALTLGEMAAVELASGQPFLTLFRAGSANRRLIALFLREFRSSGTAPSWQKLASLRPLAKRSSNSPSSPAGPPSPSSD